MNQQPFPNLVPPPITLGVSNGRRRKTKPSPERKIHLIRPALPLSSNNLTECGLKLDEDRRLIRWEDWIVNGAEQPGVREKLCQTCASTLSKQTMTPYWSWDADPLRVLNRNTHYRDDIRAEVSIDLWALVALAEKYNDEFQVMRHIIGRRKKLQR